LLEAGSGGGRPDPGHWRPDPTAGNRIQRASLTRISNEDACTGEQLQQQRHVDGLGGPVDGLAGLIHGLFLFFPSVYRGGHSTASEKVPLTMTFRPRRMLYPPRKINFTRLGKDLCSSDNNIFLVIIYFSIYKKTRSKKEK
jgi:hypothetical protein